MSRNFPDLTPLCEAIGHTFKDIKLLMEALTHPSTSHRYAVRNYERLEFLGDRVLGLVIADWLYHYYREDLEGDLAKRLAYLVSKEPLIAIARQLQLDKYMMMGRGVSSYNEERRLSLLADACEAIIAAIYLDSGLESAKAFITRYWSSMLENMDSIPKDAKSALQEWAQGLGKEPPEYFVVASEGLAHAPVFTVEARVEGVPPQQGKASSKRQAEQLAAALILKDLKK
jgi:ribonuclease-3